MFADSLLLASLHILLILLLRLAPPVDHEQLLDPGPGSSPEADIFHEPKIVQEVAPPGDRRL
eukprot:183896-Pyramimonas_sp.AAC.1